MAETGIKKQNRILESFVTADTKLPWLKYFALFYTYVCLYGLFIVNHGLIWSAGSTTYTYHLVDYGFGFLTKILPGAIFRLFFKNATMANVSAYETVLLLIAYAALSFFLARLVAGIKEKKQRVSVFVLCMFFLSGPCSFGIFSEQLGMLDSYWFFFTLIFIAVIETKYLKYIIPCLVFLMILVHFAAIITYIILCCMILLYRAACARDKKEKAEYGVIFTVTVITAIAAFLYFVLCESSNVTMTMEEFDREMLSRGEPDRLDNVYLRFYDFAFYREQAMHFADNDIVYGVTVDEIPVLSLPLPAPVLNILNLLISQSFANVKTKSEIAFKAFYIPFLLCLCLPLIAVSYSVLLKLLKSEKNKLKKFCYVLALIQYPFSAFTGLMNSNDITRFLAHALIIHIAFLLYVLYKEEKAREILAGKVYGIDPRLGAAYFFVYMMSVAETYI